MNEKDDFELWQAEIASGIFYDLPDTEQRFAVALSIVMVEVAKELGWSRSDSVDLMMIYLEAARQILEGDRQGAERYRRDALRQLRQKIAGR